MPQEANMDELIEGAAQNLELALANDPRTATPLQASEAEMALTSLFSHRGDGTPTQYFHGSEVAGHADTMWKALITTLRTLATMQAREAELVGEVARLREALEKAERPHWFYADGWEEKCLHSPDEAIDLIDYEAGEYVTRVGTARPCADIWCAVKVTDDEGADERFTFTEHATEDEARAALSAMREAQP